ncbi:MAG: SprT-like domain-containing protein, partial [Owenweeksia sp.]
VRDAKHWKSAIVPVHTKIPAPRLTAKSEHTLSKYLPEETLDLTMKLLRSAPVELRIKNPRKTKFGDYRFPRGSERHRISINGNLNPFAFLITLVHEMAHLKAFEDHGKTIKPHGDEWQSTFRELMKPYFERNVFPAALKSALSKSLQKGSASSCTDLELFRVLQTFNEKPALVVEQLNPGDCFSLGKGMIFKKGPKARKRYRCLNLANGREYMVHPLAEVKRIETEKNTKSA